MLYEDMKGNLLSQDEVFKLSPHEILERGLHLFDREPEFAA